MKYRCTLCRTEREAPPGFVQCLVCGAIMLPVMAQSPPSPEPQSEKSQ
jgi:hypothetical protein